MTLLAVAFLGIATGLLAGAYMRQLAARRRLRSRLRWYSLR